MLKYVKVLFAKDVRGVMAEHSIEVVKLYKYHPESLKT